MTSIKKCVALLTAFTMAFCVITVSDTVVEAKKSKKIIVKKVCVNAPYAKTAYIARGKSVKLSANVTVSPNKSANKKVTFKSSKKKIATVSSKGVVKAKKVGTAKITVTSKTNKKKKATVTVKVMKNPVTKVSLDKKSATLNAGSELTLKAKVSAKKGSSKRVYWTSSNAKVATVSQKGVVTAKGVGIANITVTAIDGSKKKATCNVQVTSDSGNSSSNSSSDSAASSEAVNLAGMKVENDHVITFSLDRPCKLDLSQVEVKKKTRENGVYHSTLKTESLITPDSINYKIVLATEIVLREEEFVQVSIPQLSGNTKTVEQQFLSTGAYTGERIWLGNVGEPFGLRAFTFAQEVGYSAYNEVSGLPAGLTYRIEHEYRGFKTALLIDGTPTTPGVSKVTVKAVDEVGNTFTETIIICVGSDAKLTGACTDTYLWNGGDTQISKEFRVTGGSGSYEYDIAPNDYGFTISKNTDGTANVTGTLNKAGTFQFSIIVKDAMDETITTTIPMVAHVAPGYTVTGKVVDAEGKPMSNATAYFINKDKAKNNGFNAAWETKSNPCNEDGVYTAVLPAGTYDVKVKDGTVLQEKYDTAIDYLINQKVEGDTTLPTATLPLYRVNLLAADGSVMPEDKFYWYDEENNLIFKKSSIYMRPGSYRLHTNSYSFDGEGEIGKSLSYTADFTVTGSEISVTATEKYVSLADTITALELGEDNTVAFIMDFDVAPNYKYYSFVPKETGTYQLESFCFGKWEPDPVVYIYTKEGFFDMQGDISSSDWNFRWQGELTAGTEYFFRIWGNNMTNPPYRNVEVKLSKIQ